MKRKTDPLDSVAGQILENAKKSGLEINTAEDAENLMAHMLGRSLTQMLDGEMTNHLGYERGGKRVTENERNGHSSKTLKSSSLGNIRIDVPRDRKGEFEPRVVPKHKRQLAGFEDKVLALYARGLSTREIQGFLYDEYGMETSAEFISDVTDAILPEVEKWQNRPLDPFYTTVFFDAIRVKIRGDNGIVTPKAVHLALGVNAQGRKEVLGMWVADNESAKYWLKVFTELKNRGVSDILIAVTDGLKGMKEALEAAFPNTLLQTCIVHLIRNSLKFVGYKDYKAVAGALKPIYRAVNAADARKELDAFAQSELGLRYPYIAKQWIDSWDKVIPFFDFSPNIRRLIYTTNAIESLNRDLRKVIKTRAAFPTETVALKLLFLAIRKVEKRWVRPSPYWSAAMRELVVLFGDRITPTSINLERAAHKNYTPSKEHPTLSPELIDALLLRHISIIGVDCAGVRRGAEHPPMDQHCADHDVFIVENLCHLGDVLQGRPFARCHVHTYPMNFTGMTGLPCRVAVD